MTNRKLDTRFQLVPKSTTLGDLERLLVAYSTYNNIFSEPNTKNLLSSWTTKLHMVQPRKIVNRCSKTIISDEDTAQWL